jgi:hypothetical protein
MADKKFVGSCKPGKFENQVDIGFQQKDLDAMQNAMNEKGWVNVRLNCGKDSGKPYIELITRD